MNPSALLPLALVLLLLSALVLALSGIALLRGGGTAPRRHRIGLGTALVGLVFSAWTLQLIRGHLGEDFRLPPGQRPNLSGLSFLDAGRVRRIGEFRGRPVVVDYWASWCPPCRRSLPEMAALQARARREGTFDVVTINVDERPDMLEHFLGSEGRPLLDSGFVYAKPNPGEVRRIPEGAGPDLRGIPTTLIMDASGGLACRWSGYEAGLAERRLEEVLRGR